MATVTKDFRIKSGLIVEGANATVDGSDIITEDAIAGGTQTNIAVTYDAVNKVVNFVAENGVADSDTSQLDEDPNATVDSGTMYFTNARARAAISAEPNGPVSYNSTSGEIDLSISTTGGLGVGVDNGIKVNTGTGLTVNPANELELADALTAVPGTYGSSTEIPSITVDGKGRITDISTSSISTTLNVAGNTGTAAIDLGSDTLNIVGGTGIDIAADSLTDTLTVSGKNATTSNKGIASFNTDNFTVTDGAVSAKSATIGSSSVTLGSTTSSLSGLESITVDNIEINGNSITSTDTNGNINLNPNGTGVVDVNTSRITNVAEPVNASDAATKNYVDSVASGLTWKPAVNLLSTSNVPLTGNTETVVIDGHAALDSNDVGYRLLLIGQSTAAENGIYVYDDNGTTYTLTRAADLDSVDELDGAAVFIMEGTQYGSTSWVQANHYATTFADQEWDQFSGQGTYLAGNGLTLTGNTFAIDDTIVVTESDLNGAVESLTEYIDGFLDPSTGTTVEYIDEQDAATLLAANNYSDTLVATGDPTATPQYLALNVNDVAQQVAATTTSTGSGSDNVYEFDPAEFRSAKFLVKIAYGSHTQVSEVLLTLDASNNIAITEYAMVGTNGSLGDISASWVALGPVTNVVRLIVNSASTGAVIKVMGTLLV